MKWLLALSSLVAAVAAAEHAPLWRRAVEADDVRIEVLVVSTLELSRKMNPRARLDLRNMRQDHRKGFSVLRRSRSTGALYCEIYVTDPGDSYTLEHERRHCHGWVHD